MNVSVAHLSRYEMVRVLEQLTAMIDCSPDGMVLGLEVKGLNPILAAIKMFRELKPNTFEVQRELIPGDPSTIEVFDVAEMTYDDEFLRETEEYINDNALDRETLLSTKKTAAAETHFGEIRFRERN